MKKHIFFIMLIVNGLAIGSDQNCRQCGEGALRSLTEPCGVYIELTGQYAVPTETGLGTFTDSWQYADQDGGVTSLSKPSKANYDPAGGIKLGYDFPCSAKMIEVEYSHLYNSKHNYNDTSDNPISFGSVFFNTAFPLTPDDPFVSDAYLRYTVDQGAILLGHRFITESCCMAFTPLVGVRYARLEHDLTFAVGNVRSHYSGAGPLIGFDFIYNFFKCLSLTAHFDTSLLMGSVKSSSLLTFGAINRFESPSTGRVVTALGGRLGLAYEYVLCKKSSINLEIGYETNQYIGAFDIITSYVEPIQRIHNIGTTNLGVSGPYIKLTWHM